MKKYTMFSCYVIATALGVSNAAQASAPDAWEQFRKEVATKCTAEAAKRKLERISAIVDPFGSPQFGFAFITGINRHTKNTTYTYICVFDKKKETVELSNEWDTKKLKLQPMK